MSTFIQAGLVEPGLYWAGIARESKAPRTFNAIVEVSGRAPFFTLTLRWEAGRPLTHDERLSSERVQIGPRLDPPKLRGR